MTASQHEYMELLENVLARYLFDRGKCERTKQLGAVIEALESGEPVWAVILCGAYEMPDEMTEKISSVFDVRRV
jgi:hypothetical protein